MGHTAFSNWRENGGKDPFQDYLEKGNITCKDINSKLLSQILLLLSDSNANPISKGVMLAAGKERLRWLSRKLYSISHNHEEICSERATLKLGNLTDDQLANKFFMTEESFDILAGSERIEWLYEKIIKIDSEGDIKNRE